MIVHPGTEIGNDLEGPALAGAIQFQHLLLSFQIVFLVVSRPKFQNIKS
jgi:hypothetical protein